MKDTIYYYKNMELDELSYEVYLLKEFLMKKYSEEEAVLLIQEYSDNLYDLAKMLGEQDFRFFNLFYLRNIFTPSSDNVQRNLSKAHMEMWDLLQETLIEGKQDKINIVCPRGFAKTITCDLAVTVWAHCYKKSTFTLLIAKRGDDSIQFLAATKNQFENNEYIIRSFGKLIDKRIGLKVNANEVEFTNETYVRCMGADSSCRGANWHSIRPTLVIGDDAQSEADVLTEQARDKKYQKWLKEVENVGEKPVYRNKKLLRRGTIIISIGTVLHIDCLISRLSRNISYKTFLRRAIVLDKDETVDDIFTQPLWKQFRKIYFNSTLENSKAEAEKFYNENENDMQYKVLWEKWSCFELACQYFDDRQSFMSEMMNDASAIGEKWFTSVKTLFKEEIDNHNFKKTILAVDPATSTKKNADYTAMVVLSESNNGFWFVRDLVLERLEYEDYCNKVIEVIQNNQDITHIYVEKNTYAGTDVLRIKEIMSKNKIKNNYTWINERTNKNKDEKIENIISPVNNGQIIIPEDLEDSYEFIQQLKSFQGQKWTEHDDAADALAEAYIRIKDLQNTKYFYISSYR
ncbi:MAG: terminase [Clostridium butyricum]|nr:terminase [Clostridium butyricum]